MNLEESEILIKLEEHQDY